MLGVYVGRTQKERYEVRCRTRKSTVVPGCRFILVGQILCHRGAFPGHSLIIGRDNVKE